MNPFGWGGPSLLAGEAGTALVFRYAARALPAEAGRWEELSQHHLAAAARSTHDAPLDEPGMAGGTAGLALAVADCVRDEPRYAALLRSLDERLAGQIAALPPGHTVATDGVGYDLYDAIAGLSGVLAHLTATPTLHEPGPAGDAVRQATESVTAELVALSTSRTADGWPSWYVHPRYYPSEDYRGPYPHGYLNLGLAHGIPGILAALSFALTAGVRTPRLAETVRDIADYLIEVSFEDDSGRNWPSGIPLDASGAETRSGLTPARTAWCYGAPGVACALLDAADALGDAALRTVAVDAFDAVLRRFAAAGRFSSATLCHGAAGLVVICAAFARRTTSGAARGELPALVAHLLSHCDAALPLGVQDLEQPGVLLDSPGVLTGAGGVALALWAAAGPAEPHWTRALLVA
ncbi:lanthionine synthetase C family protein [Streptomyces sp. SYSU K21746]